MDMKEEIAKYLKIGLATTNEIMSEDFKSRPKDLIGAIESFKSETSSSRLDLSDEEKVGVVLLNTSNSYSFDRKMSNVINTKVAGVQELFSEIFKCEKALEDENVVDGMSTNVDEEVEGLGEVLPIIKKIVQIEGVGISTLPAFLYKGKVGAVKTIAVKKDEIKDFLYEIDFKTTVDNFVFVYGFGKAPAFDTENFYIRYAVIKK
jgi:hypothetical protein